MIISRIAPTPSGYLHLGNAFNFIYTWSLTRQKGGKLHLRIDDSDTKRCRDEFIEDIFDSLEWLGVDWDHGPKSTSDFKSNYSQTAKVEHYFKSLDNIEGLYSCSCSRREISNVSPTGIYPKICLDKNISFELGKTAIRMNVTPNTVILVGDESVQLDKVMGDFVIWTKDKTPAYQLVSLLEDIEMGVNLIVRGDDLLHSTAAQLYMASKMKKNNSFYNTEFIHHKIIEDNKGKKLSKRGNSVSLKSMRKQNVSPLEVLRRIASIMEIDPNLINSIDDILNVMRQHNFEFIK